MRRGWGEIGGGVDRNTNRQKMKGCGGAENSIACVA